MTTIGAAGFTSALDLNPKSEELLRRTREVASGCAARAAHYDQVAQFPADDFADLIAARLHAHRAQGIRRTRGRAVVRRYADAVADDHGTGQG